MTELYIFLSFVLHVIKKKDQQDSFYLNIHSSVIHSTPKVQTTHMSINRWMDKQNVAISIHTMDYYSVNKKNEVLYKSCYNIYGP